MDASNSPVPAPAARKRGGRKIALTLRIAEADFAALQTWAKADNRSPTNYVETALLQNIAARAEAARTMTMAVPHDAAALTPGPLLRSAGESDERYALRLALMDRLFAMPDTA